MSHSKLRQGLPCLYEAHLGLNEAHLGHILMSFQNTGGNLRIMHMWTLINKCYKQSQLKQEYRVSTQTLSLGNNPREERNTRHFNMKLPYPITTNITVNIWDASSCSSNRYGLLYMPLNIHTLKPLQSQLPLFSPYFPRAWNIFTWRNEWCHWSLPLIDDLLHKSFSQLRISWHAKNCLKGSFNYTEAPFKKTFL